jgi:hypothetical protein
MIWGEPTRNFLPIYEQRTGERINGGSKGAAPRRYARLLDAAYGALKRVRRSNVVIGGNTFVTGTMRPGNWIRNMKLSNGRPPRMDLYGHNPFSARRIDICQGPGPEDIMDFSDSGRLARTVDRYLARPRRTTIGLFFSEIGFPTDRLDQTFSFFFSREEAARRLSRVFRLARGMREVYAVGYWQMFDLPAGPGDERPESTVGLIDAEGNRKPGFDAFKGASTRRTSRARCWPRIPRR